MHRFASVPVLAGILLSSAVPAQDDPFRFVPKDAQIVVRAKGLDGMLEHFAATDIGSVLARPEIRKLLPDLIGDLSDEVDFFTPSEKGQADPIQAELLQILGAHNGWMTLAMWIDPKIEEHPDPAYSGTEFFQIVMAIELGEAVPLERLKGFCDLVAQAFESEDAELRELEGFDGMRTVDMPDSRLVLPTIHDGRLLCAVSRDPQTMLGRLLLEGQHYEEQLTEQDRSSALWARVDPEYLAFYLNALSTPSRQDGEQEPQPEKSIADRLGIGGLGAMTGRIRPDAERLVVEFEVRTDPGEVGLVDGLLPVKLTTPPLLDLIDRSRPRWDRSWVDWEQLFDVAEAAAQLSGTLPPGTESIAAYIESTIGINFREDVLAKLDGQILLLDPAEGGIMPGALGIFLSEGVIGIGCRDADGLRASITKAARSQGLHVQIEESDYRGHEIWDLSLFAPIALGFGDRALWIAGGENPEALIRSMLDAETAVAEGKRFGDWPTSITELRKSLGWKASSLRYGQMDSFLQTYFPTEPLAIRDWLGIRAFLGTPSDDFLESVDPEYRAQLEAEHAAYNRTAGAAKALLDGLRDAGLDAYLSGAQTEPARRIYRWVF